MPGRTNSRSLILHVAIEALGNTSGGGATVLQRIVQAALEHDSVSEVTVFLADKADRDFEIRGHDNLRVVEMGRLSRNPLVRVSWVQLQMSRACSGRQVDSVLSLNAMGIGKPAPTVVFIQQPIPFHPEAFLSMPLKTRVRMRGIRLLMKRACRLADRIVVQNSDMALRASVAFGVDPTRISTVVPDVQLPTPGSNWKPLEAMLATRQDRRLLYCGSTSQHKNVRVLVEAMPALREELPGAELFLTWPSDSAVTKVEGVTCLGWLDEEAISAAYKTATAVCMPSLAETVGLPQLEAMAIGTPVLAADRPYAHAICGDAAMFFDPRDSADFCAHAVELLTNPAMRLEMIAKGFDRVSSLDRGDPYGQLMDVVADVGQRTPATT